MLTLNKTPPDCPKATHPSDVTTILGSNPATIRRAARDFLIACVAAPAVSAAAWADDDVVLTQDARVVSFFSTGSTVLGFDELVGNLWPPGSPVIESAEVAGQYAACAGVVVSSGGGGSAAAVTTFNTPLQGDAASPWNVLAPTQDFGVFSVLDYDQPIRFDFVGELGQPVPMSRVGFWNDPTGSRIRLSAYDAADALLASVEADEGYFVGIEAKPGESSIAWALVEHLTNQSGLGYTLDDLVVRPLQPADLDRSGAVDGADLGLLLNAWGSCSSQCCLGDITGDGAVDGADLGEVLGGWG